MKRARGFCDFNIRSDCFPSIVISDVLRRAFKLGYQTVAVNTVITDTSLLQTKKKKKKKQEDEEAAASSSVPLPPTLELKESDYECLQVVGKKPIVLQRLTVVMSDITVIPKLNHSEEVKKYDLLAILPTTPETFQQACTSMEIDIITFDELKASVRFNRKMYNLGVERGIYFEVMYAPAILDYTCRKNIICTAHNYHTIGKSKNVFISSGAKSPAQLRGPYDVANLSLLFGLSEGEAKDAISRNCREMFIHAESRRTGKCVMSVMKTSDLPESERWKVKDSDSSSSEAEDEEMEVEDVT